MLLLSVYASAQELDKPIADGSFRSVITTTKKQRLSPVPGKNVFASPKPSIAFRLVKLNESQFFLRLQGVHDQGGLIIEKGQVATIRFTDNSELVLNAEHRYAVHPSHLEDRTLWRNRSGVPLGWENDYQLNADAVAALKGKDIKEIVVGGSRAFLYPIDPVNKDLVGKSMPAMSL